MHSSKTHIAIRFFLLLVMFITSTGFTAIVSYCTMSGESECCCATETENKAAIPGQQKISVPDESCFLKTVAGGINEIRGTFDVTPFGKDITLSCSVLCSFSPSIYSSIEETSSFITDHDVSPPPGNDLYIQYHSYLI